MSKRSKKKRISKKGEILKWVLPFILSSVIIIVGIFIYANTYYKPSNTYSQLKAAIVDQLYSTYPNKEFIAKATKELNKYGFDVTVYKGKDVNVRLFRALPAYGYSLIIIRAHSGLSTVNGKLTQKTFIFTNEKYSHIKYTKEQLNSELFPAKVTENSQGFFAVGPKFITDCMQDRFSNTVVVMAGCTGLHVDDLAKAFIEKGASCFIAWDASVDLDYMDKAVMNFIPHLLDTRSTIKGAIDTTMKEVGPDPEYNAFLEYYPPWAKDRTLKQLIGK